MMYDPIADMLLRIRNAIKAGLPTVDVPASRIKNEIARVLKEEGYIVGYEVTAEGARKVLSIELKYNDAAESAIRGLRRESKPGLRKFCGYEDVPVVLGGLGTAVLSTSGGVMSGKTARSRKVGGELLCVVW